MPLATDTPPPPEASGPKHFKVGTLVYTRAGLFMLFAWLLWADVCFVLMEAVPNLIPLKLKSIETPNWLMAVMLSTIPMFLNATVCPWVSFKSDRHRGKLGRRMPFILYTAPFLTVSLIAIGFSEPISHFLRGLLANMSVEVSANAMQLIVIAIFSTMFAFFNMFIGSVFWYLFNDLVPQEMLSRFLSLMRMVSTGTGAFYSFFIFKHADTHMPWIFLGGALLYFVTFTLLCLNVKEGKYPPPDPNADGKTGAISSIKTYAKECFSHRIYWFYFLYTGFSCVAGAIGIFTLFLQLQMGLTLEKIGQLAGFTGIWAICLLYFGGIVADRFHPMRTLLIAVAISTLFSPIGLLWLFFNPSPQAYFYIALTLSFLLMPVGVMMGVSGMPAEMRLFPKKNYGQFCSANAMVRSVLVMAGGVGAGAFMDVMKSVYKGSDYAYRYSAVWSTIFGVIGFFFLYLTYREWKRRGGSESYVAPTIEDGRSETVASSEATAAS